MFSLLVRLLHEPPEPVVCLGRDSLGGSREGDIVPVEEGRHGEVDVRGVELDVDLLVDGGLDLGLVVLTDFAD